MTLDHLGIACVEPAADRDLPLVAAPGRFQAVSACQHSTLAPAGAVAHLKECQSRRLLRHDSRAGDTIAIGQAESLRHPSAEQQAPRRVSGTRGNRSSLRKTTKDQNNACRRPLHGPLTIGTNTGNPRVPTENRRPRPASRPDKPTEVRGGCAIYSAVQAIAISADTNPQQGQRCKGDTLFCCDLEPSPKHWRYRADGTCRIAIGLKTDAGQPLWLRRQRDR